MYVIGQGPETRCHCTWICTVLLSLLVVGIIVGVIILTRRATAQRKAFEAAEKDRLRQLKKEQLMAAAGSRKETAEEEYRKLLESRGNEGVDVVLTSEGKEKRDDLFGAKFY